jgi:glycosyltransferase involved in cell wall biosynthesis
MDVVAHIDAGYGGMSVCVPALARATAAADRYTSLLVAFCHQHETAEFQPDRNFQFIRMPLSKVRPLDDFSTRACLHPLMKDVDVVHIHGIWSAHCAAAGLVASRHGTPYVVSAHGMLDGWALDNKRWKKILYSALVERPNLRRCACLRALTTAEVHNFRSYGLSNPIALIPNGVHIPKNIDAALFFERHPELKDRKLILYLSRIHYKKGLDLLCQAWAGISGRFPEAHLVIAGPDFEGIRAAIEKLVQDLRIRSRVSFAGLLTGQYKWSALAAARVFVLPSHSEGFSVATLEALASSRPVIITHQCNFPEVEQLECGWLIQPDVQQLKSALIECLAASDSQLARLGDNGRALVARRYNWSTIGQQMSDVYDWILGGSKPTSTEIFT